MPRILDFIPEDEYDRWREEERQRKLERAQRPPEPTPWQRAMQQAQTQPEPSYEMPSYKPPTYQGPSYQPQPEPEPEPQPEVQQPTPWQRAMGAAQQANENIRQANPLYSGAADLAGRYAQGVRDLPGAELQAAGDIAGAGLQSYDWLNRKAVESATRLGDTLGRPLGIETPRSGMDVNSPAYNQGIEEAGRQGMTGLIPEGPARGAAGLMGDVLNKGILGQGFTEEQAALYNNPTDPLTAQQYVKSQPQRQPQAKADWERWQTETNNPVVEAFNPAGFLGPAEFGAVARLGAGTVKGLGAREALTAAREALPELGQTARRLATEQTGAVNLSGFTGQKAKNLESALWEAKSRNATPDEIETIRAQYMATEPAPTEIKFSNTPREAPPLRIYDKTPEPAVVSPEPSQPVVKPEQGAVGDEARTFAAKRGFQQDAARMYEQAVKAGVVSDAENVVNMARAIQRIPSERSTSDLVAMAEALQYEANGGLDKAAADALAGHPDSGLGQRIADIKAAMEGTTLTPEPAQAATTAQGTKQPWELNTDDYVAANMENALKTRGYRDLKGKSKAQQIEEALRQEHYDAVDAALRAGEQVPTEAKPIWARTQAEDVAYQVQAMKAAGNPEAETPGMIQTIKDGHRQEVEATLQYTDEPIPPEVLADYPDLAAKATPANAAPTPEVPATVTPEPKVPAIEAKGTEIPPSPVKALEAQETRLEGAPQAIVETPAAEPVKAAKTLTSDIASGPETQVPQIADQGQIGDLELPQTRNIDQETAPSNIPPSDIIPPEQPPVTPMREEPAPIEASIRAPRTAGFQQFWDRSRNVIASQGPAGKELSDLLRKTRDIAETTAGGWVHRLPTVRKLNNTEFTNFVDVAEGKAQATAPVIQQAAKEWAKVREDIHGAAQNAMLDVGRLEDYFPHSYDPKMFQGDNWVKSVKHLVKTGQAPNAEEAAQMLRHAQDTIRNRRQGNLEIARMVDLPEYEKTKQALFRYIESAANRIAQVRVLGQDDAIAMRLINKIGADGGDASASKNLFDIAVGAKKYGDIQKEISAGLRAYNVITKLGLGALTNAGQSVNTLTVAGVLRTLSNIPKAALNEEARMEALKAGTILDGTLQNLREGGGFAGKLGKIGAPGFNTVEAFNRILAGEVGKSYATNMAAQAMKGSRGAIDALETMGLDAQAIIGRGGALNEKEQIQAARNMVERTQFKVDPQDLPGWASSPAGKMLMQFRTFSYNQSAFVGREIVQPAVKGNVRPLLRFLIFGLPVGVAGVEIQNFLRNRPSEEDPVKRITQYYQKVGGLGILGDLVTGLSPMNSRYLDPARYATMAIGMVGGPTVSTIAEGLGALPGALNENKSGERNFTNLERFALKQIPLVGPTLKNTLLPYKPAGSDTSGLTPLEKRMRQSGGSQLTPLEKRMQGGNKSLTPLEKRMKAGGK